MRMFEQNSMHKTTKSPGSRRRSPLLSAEIRKCDSDGRVGTMKLNAVALMTSSR